MRPNAPPAAKPTRSTFDPFNSSATGHQRADNTLGGSTSWRDSRTLKLREQFSGGTKRVSDTVGAGSRGFGKDGRMENGGWAKGAKGLRTGGQQSIVESMVGVNKDVERPAKRQRVDKQQNPTKGINPSAPFRKEDGTIRESSWTSHGSSPSALLSPIDLRSPTATATAPHNQIRASVEEAEVVIENAVPRIFASYTIYINGSTAPTISDHKLKHLISNHGGRMSIALGRRTVTHVILGRPNSGSGGCGGGLSGSKLQKEITRKGGCAVKYVTVDWVVESIKAGRRLPESRFAAMKLAPKGVASVASMFGKRKESKEGSTSTVGSSADGSDDLNTLAGGDSDEVELGSGDSGEMEPDSEKALDTLEDYGSEEALGFIEDYILTVATGKAVEAAKRSARRT
ncbi:hypothetical protein LTR08_003290 [Meristemomyces frigidus]|nr:hypothetical protein LTR08_003290 [Meristemomyces frigidus]